jgi:hypothetical protein
MVRVLVNANRAYNPDHFAKIQLSRCYSYREIGGRQTNERTYDKTNNELN